MGFLDAYQMPKTALTATHAVPVPASPAAYCQPAKADATVSQSFFMNISELVTWSHKEQEYTGRIRQMLMRQMGFVRLCIRKHFGCNQPIRCQPSSQFKHVENIQWEVLWAKMWWGQRSENHSLQSTYAGRASPNLEADVQQRPMTSSGVLRSERQGHTYVLKSGTVHSRNFEIHNILNSLHHTALIFLCQIHTAWLRAPVHCLEWGLALNLKP